jgi:toxin ParE1/3/4
MGAAWLVKVRYTPSANAELGAVLEYIRERSPRGARKVRARIGDLISLLSQYPYAGSQTNDPGLLCVTASPYPSLIFYEVNEAEEEVIIIAVRHSARDPTSMPDTVRP